MNNKKTIVILTHVGFDNSPYCNYVHEHAKALVNEGYNVIALAHIPWIPILSNLQKYKKRFMKNIKQKRKINSIDGVTVIYKKGFSVSNLLYNSRINLNGIFYYHSIKRLFKKIYKKNDIILIDAHTFKVEGYAAQKLKRKYKIRTTITLHGTSFIRNLETKNGKEQIQKYIASVDYAICVSDKFKNLLNKLGIENTKVIYNGINQLKKKSNVRKVPYSILIAGWLVRRKNFDLVIKVVKELIDDYPKIMLTIAGDGQEMGNLKQLTQDLNLNEHVEFYGEYKNNEINEIMQEKQIFIMPSINEGFGIVYVEAMYNDCITIGTKGEGIDGFIKDEVNGFLVEPSIDSIVSVIRKIYNNEYNLNTISNNAYIDAQQLTWKNNAQKYIKIL